MEKEYRDHTQLTAYADEVENSIRAQGFQVFYSYHQNDAAGEALYHGLKNEFTQAGTHFATTQVQGNVKLWVKGLLEKTEYAF